MTKKPRATFWDDFKTFFLRGLAVLLPTVLTLWLLVQAYRFVQNNVAEPINAGIRQLVIQAAPVLLSKDHLPEWFTITDIKLAAARFERERQSLRPLSDEALRSSLRARSLSESWDSLWYLRFIGLIVAIVLIYLAGLLLGGYIGRRVYFRAEELMTRVPFFRQIYPHVKQVVEFLFGQRTEASFKQVGLVEYPRKGIWTIGLITGSSLGVIHEEAGEDCVAIFIPSSPTPFTGYTITVPRSQVIELPLSIDEALRFVISGGVLTPEGAELTPAEASRRIQDAASHASPEKASDSTPGDAEP